MTRHASKLVYDEGENAQLWDIKVFDGQFICKSWGLSLDEADAYSGDSAEKILRDKVPEKREFDNLDEVYRFFASEGDPMLATHALELVKKIDPDWTGE
jgi:hypothetical protein